MYIRRYYPHKVELEKTYSDEFFEQIVKSRGIDIALKMDNASYEIIFEDEEERTWYVQKSRQRVIDNPRWYLDNLHHIPTITTSQKIYDKNINCFTLDGQNVVDWAEKPKSL